MEPRLKTSTQWTPFPDEFRDQILSVVNEHFKDYDLENGRFIVEGEIYPTEIVLRIGLQKPGQLRQDNFEASLEYDATKENALKRIHFMVDFLGETWEQFLEDGSDDEDVDLPRLWTKNDFENTPIYLKYTSENTDLEQEANRLLGLEDKNLVYGEARYDEPTTEDSTGLHH